MAYGSKRKTFQMLIALLAISSFISCTPRSIRPDRSENPVIIDPFPLTAQGKVDITALETKIGATNFGPIHTAWLPCQSDPVACEVPIQVQEIGKSVDVAPANGPGGQRIIGKWTNNDPAETSARYGLQPKSSYYIYLKAVPNNPTYKSRTQWGIIDPAGNAQEIGYVIACHKYNNNHSVSHLDFQYCDGSPTKMLRSTEATRSALNGTRFIFAKRVSTEAAATAVIAETWFECPPGCCTGTSAK